MRILLIANTIFEYIVALVVLFAPSLLTGNASGSTTMARVLGANAVGLGTLSGALLLLNLLEPRQLRGGLVALAVFHTTVTFMQLLNVLDGATPFPVLLVHGLFAVSFVTALVRNLQKTA